MLILFDVGKCWHVTLDLFVVTNLLFIFVFIQNFELYLYLWHFCISLLCILATEAENKR